jgi:putative addiction module CopG family antidote
MDAKRQFSITLPIDVVEAVEARIKSGAYSSVSEVLGDGLRALVERDSTLETWLREEVVAGHKAYLDDPSQGVPADAILGRITASPSSRIGVFLSDPPFVDQRVSVEGLHYIN